MNGLQLATTTLARKPFQTICAVLGVAVACVSADLLVSVVRNQASGLESLRSDYDLVVGPKTSGPEILLGGLGRPGVPREVVPYALVRFLDRRAELFHRVPIYRIGEHHGFPIEGVDEHYWSRPEAFTPPNLVAGRPCETTGEAVIGVGVADQLGLDLGDPIRLALPPLKEGDDSRWETNLQVVGIADNSDGRSSRSVFLTLESSWEYYRWLVERGELGPVRALEVVSYILVSARDSELDFVETKIHEGSTVQVVRIQEEIEFLSGLTGAADGLVRILSVFVFALATLAIAVFVNGRFDTLKPELGILRALGYTRSEIAQCVIVETLIPVLLGVFLSVILEALVFSMGGSFLSMGPLAVDAGWPSLSNFLLWALFAGASVLAAVIPILRLYRTDPARAMEGV